jgi:hypothetical protein
LEIKNAENININGISFRILPPILVVDKESLRRLFFLDFYLFVASLKHAILCEGQKGDLEHTLVAKRLHKFFNPVRTGHPGGL